MDVLIYVYVKCVGYFFFQAEDGIRDHCVTGVQTCALPISVGALTALVAIQKQGSNSSSSGNQFTPADKASVSKALTRLQNNKAAGVAAPTASGNPVANLLNKSDILMKVDSSVLPASAQAAM